MDFLQSIKERSRANRKTIVLPESLERRTLDACHVVLKEEIADVILIGNKDEILEKGEGLNLSKAIIIDPETYEKTSDLSNKLFELRKSKGLTQEEAENLIKTNPLYMGVMLVKDGIADGMVAGALNSTADVLRPSLQILKTAPNTKLVSSFFIMVVPNCEYGENGVFMFSDCALVQNPSAEELSDIARSSAASFNQIIGKDPVVAMLSHSTLGSAKHADVTKVAEATKILKEAEPNLAVFGEAQLDSAIVPSVGQQKAPNAKEAGQANVLVFPDLDAGNIGYKLVQRLAKAEAYGPITQGISRPVNDLSRGCSAEDIIGVVAITALQAQHS